MNLLYAKLCEYACQLANGRHCLIGMFDNIQSPMFPLHHPPIFFSVQVEFDVAEQGTEAAISLDLIDQDGRPVMQFAHPPVPIPRDECGNPTRILISAGTLGVRFDHPGMYRLDVMCNGEKIGEERLPVLHAKMQGPVPPPG